jgi:NADPH-dependent curcumin reductase CurA
VTSTHTSVTARGIHLVARVQGLPTAADLRIVETPLPEPAPGQILVRNRWFALRSVMRSLMSEQELPMPRYEPGAALWGPALGQVIRSGGGAGSESGSVGESGLVAGSWVAHNLGWRDFALVDVGRLRQVGSPGLESRESHLVHLAQFETAYVGLVAAARLRAGDTVFISGAAGSVGSMAGQIARLKGAGRVIGSAGGAEKAAWLVNELGFDAAFDHRDGPVVEQLRRAAPEGIDVYFDNVGGEQLRAAVELARPGARFALCGALEQQGGGAAGVQLDAFAVIAKRLSLLGFTAYDHPELVAQGEKEVVEWVRLGRLTVPSVRYRGLDQAPEALFALLDGRHTGNVLVELP